VRGKQSWRITNAVPEKNLFSKMKNDERRLRLLAHIFSLLRKLVPGEEKNHNLFSIVRDGLNSIELDFSHDEIKNLEAVLVLRMLHNLGYIGKNPELEIFLENPSWDMAFVSEISGVRKKAVETINYALLQSQL